MNCKNLSSAPSQSLENGAAPIEHTALLALRGQPAYNSSGFMRQTVTVSAKA